MIGEPHLRALEALDTSTVPTELAASLGISVKHASETLSELEEIGVVSSEKHGRSRVYRLVDTRALVSYKSLVSRHPGIDFPELLSQSTLHVLFYLGEERTPSELVLMAKPSQATIYRVLNELGNRGILSRTNDDRWVVRDEYRALVDFAWEIALLRQSSIWNRDLSGTGNYLVWNNPYEFIGVVREINDDPVTEVGLDWMPNTEEVDGRYFLTGLEVLEELDLGFLTTTGYSVFYTENEEYASDMDSDQSHGDSINDLPLEDLACHLYITQSNSLNQRYTLLFLARTQGQISSEHLNKRAIHYDIHEGISNLLDYLDNEGETTSDEVLPSWQEFTTLANEYNVEV